MFTYYAHVCVVVLVFSTTTAQEVIATLLAKFQITDNPRKFALYESLTTTNNEKETSQFSTIYLFNLYLMSCCILLIKHTELV